MGPVRAEWGLVRAEWGWGGGHALGFNLFILPQSPGYKDRPSGAQLNYSKTRPWLQEQARLSGVGEGLGMHWDSIKLL